MMMMMLAEGKWSASEHARNEYEVNTFSAVCLLNFRVGAWPPPAKLHEYTQKPADYVQI